MLLAPAMFRPSHTGMTATCTPNARARPIACLPRASTIFPFAFLTISGKKDLVLSELLLGLAQVLLIQQFAR